MKFLAVFALAVLATGCATNSDIEGLQAQIDVLKPKVNTLTVEVADTKVVAKAALDKATAAEIAANKAAAACAETNAKLDRMFKKAQFK